MHNAAPVRKTNTEHLEHRNMKVQRHMYQRSPCGACGGERRPLPRLFPTFFAYLGRLHVI